MEKPHCESLRQDVEYNAAPTFEMGSNWPAALYFMPLKSFI